MSDKIKISQLPLKGELDGEEVIPLAHSGATYGVLMSTLQSYMGGLIEDGSITTAKINNSAVTEAKIASGAVTTGKLADSSVTEAKVADGVITEAKLSSEVQEKLNSASGGSGDVSISGMINLTDLTAVQTAQSELSENEVRFFVIADNAGKMPSTQKCYDVPVDVARQLSLKTGNNLVDAVLNTVEVESFGVSVGDLIAITKVSVSLSDLSEYLGVSFSLSGNITIYQYKMMHTTVAREENYETACTKGVRGLLTPWEKTILNGSAKPTRWNWGYNLDQCLQSGVLAFTSAEIAGVTANWTIFVDCSATPDDGGYYHLTQMAVGRDNVNLGSIYVRLGYYVAGGSPTFNPWREVTSDGGNIIKNADFLSKDANGFPVNWTEDVTNWTNRYVFGNGYVTLRSDSSISQSVSLEVGKRYMLKFNVSSMNLNDYPVVTVRLANATSIYLNGVAQTYTDVDLGENTKPVEEHTIVFTDNGVTEIEFSSDADGGNPAPSISKISLVCVGEGTIIY